MFVTLLCIFIIISLLFIVGWLSTTNKFDTYIKSFIEYNNDITVITSDTEIMAINQEGLNFFHFKTVKAFKKRHKYLSKLFIELDADDTKYVEGINWVTKIDKMQNIKIEMHNEKLKQIFYMNVSKMKKNRYLVVFHNISRVIAEKEAITKVAENDELTQIYNRSKFNNILSMTLRNSAIYGDIFTLILLDIDHFKNVNDTYGHNVGDKVLIQLSSLIKSQLRSHDTFARWGGEEFVILSENSTKHDVYALAERLRKCIETFPFDTVEHISCSFGLSEYIENDTAISLLKRADDALYEAKENGRNIVCPKIDIR